MTTTAFDDQFEYDYIARSYVLDRIAMDIDTWPERANLGCDISESGWTWRDDEYYAVLISNDEKFQITRDHWLDRREEFINTPLDSDSPQWAVWFSQNSDGKWYWHEMKPHHDHNGWCMPNRNGEKQTLARSGKIPEGHDWRATLTRINREDARYDSITGIKHRIQSRQDAEHPHEADARWLDEQFGAFSNAVKRNVGMKFCITPTANSILNKAAHHMQDRAATYDKPEGERSMAATVAAFNAVTGDGVMNTEERGWLFMQLLKAVRSQQGDYRADSYEDGAAYVALAGEAAAKHRAK